jgi:hypothetical protein
MQWEYWVENVRPEWVEDELTRLGGLGWELVSVVFNEGEYKLFFKRQMHFLASYT